MLGTRKWIAAAAAALIACGAHAADAPYPARPVKIEVGANAGGGTDIIARMLAEKFQTSTRPAVRRREQARRVEHHRRRLHGEGPA